MARLTKKGLNLKVCGHGMTWQAFFNIEVAEDHDEEGAPKYFPGILTIKEGGGVNEALIDLELKHLFKGESGWAIKKLGEDEYLVDFPSEDLRNELTKFKGFEFATTTAIVKAKVEPTNIEREAICALEETWVRASGFPRKAKKEMVIREISHLVRDPIEVDMESLKNEGAIRVKVPCMDALKVKGNTLVFINKQGYLIRWKSERLGADKGDDSFDENSPKGDGSDGEGESNEFGDSHDSGFAKMAREWREEEKKKRQLKKASGSSKVDEMDWEAMAQGEFSLSQTRKQKDILECSSRQQMEVESAYRPPCGFWRIDNQQLEI
jgi:hypothetical protein